jgi:Zn-dependent protease
MNFLNRSFPIGSLFGITVRVHVLFVVLFAAIVLTLSLKSGLAGAIAFTVPYLMLFLFVLLHELGHSVVAQIHGIRVHDIVLWPLGGMARLGRIPEDPGTEMRIAIAGPLVNLVLAALFLPFHLWMGGALFGFGAGHGTAAAGLAGLDLAGYAVLINLMMGAFNLIPAFPMDGGRIFRAALARRSPYLDATRTAVRVGRTFALVAGLCALFSPGMLTIALIAVFVWAMGGQELRVAEARAAERAGAEGFAAAPEPGPGADARRSPAADRFLFERRLTTGGREVGELDEAVRRWVDRFRAR